MYDTGSTAGKGELAASSGSARGAVLVLITEAISVVVVVLVLIEVVVVIRVLLVLLLLLLLVVMVVVVVVAVAAAVEVAEGAVVLVGCPLLLASKILAKSSSRGRDEVGEQRCSRTRAFTAGSAKPRVLMRY